ncbi:MAG TPA: leishmanolysin-related zinc metalloendopeptidase [Longimicrobiales bacterium]|nr:leishmanolysin-related zinc metalloendopeptidase [Longimicrobiales bacterium]
MKRLHTCYALLAAGLLLGACNESSFDPQEPATVSVSGSVPTSRAVGQTVTPTVVVRDVAGRVVAGAVVTFQVTAGGGSVSSSTVTTNNSGTASVTWTLGPEPGVNTLVATVPGLDPVTFTVTTCGVFCIDIRYVGTVSAAQEAAFTNARLRWQQVITGDLPNVQMNIPAGACKDADGEALVDHPAVNEVVDDLLVYVQVDSIDGPGKVLGSAGPCYIRNTSRLPVFGIMRFDRADLTLMAQNGILGDVILHELGHVLGFPTIWSDPQFGLLQDTASNPYFSGTGALSAFQLAGGVAVNGVGVPVENTGGEGTRLSHWREAVLGNELMTGFISAGGNPLSAITIGSLEDIGYTVDYNAADLYSVPSPQRALWNASTWRYEITERPMAAPHILP